jgi:hypothetical protein
MPDNLVEAFAVKLRMDRAQTSLAPLPLLQRRIEQMLKLHNVRTSSGSRAHVLYQFVPSVILELPQRKTRIQHISPEHIGRLATKQKLRLPLLVSSARENRYLVFEQVPLRERTDSIHEE